MADTKDTNIVLEGLKVHAFCRTVFNNAGDEVLEEDHLRLLEVHEGDTRCNN